MVDQPPARRALGLDAVRGIAILLMCLSGLVPAFIPNFMKHGYYPTSLPNDDGVFVRVDNPHTFYPDWPAFTWVDHVFPLFLFAMGAAIPLAGARRIENGESIFKRLLEIVGRWLSLIAFAVIIQHVRPGIIAQNVSLQTACWLSLAAFVVLFAVFAKLPKQTPAGLARGIRIGGVVTIVSIVGFLASQRKDGFSWGTHDIIILLLAHSYLITAILWTILPRLGSVRLLVGGAIALVAHCLALAGSAAKFPQWIWLPESINDFLVNKVGPIVSTPRDWLNVSKLISDTTNFQIIEPMRGVLNFSPLWDFTWYKFVLLVVLGTIAGDLLLKWQRGEFGRPPTEPTHDRNVGLDRVELVTPAGLASNINEPIFDETKPNLPRWLAFSLALLAVIGAYAGLRHYDHPTFGLKMLSTPWVALPFTLGPLTALAAFAFLFRDPAGGLLSRLIGWGVALTALGLFFAVLPMNGTYFEGGISKGPPARLAWYLISAGLGFVLVYAFTLSIDCSSSPRGGVLVANGQNPLLAYAGIGNLLQPLVSLPLLLPLGLAGIESISDAANAMIRSAFTIEIGTEADWPWAFSIWSFARMLLLALMIWAFTRRRIVWKV